MNDSNMVEVATTTFVHGPYDQAVSVSNATEELKSKVPTVFDGVGGCLKQPPNCHNCFKLKLSKNGAILNS